MANEFEGVKETGPDDKLTPVEQKYWDILLKKIPSNVARKASRETTFFENGVWMVRDANFNTLLFYDINEDQDESPQSPERKSPERQTRKATAVSKEVQAAILRACSRHIEKRLLALNEIIHKGVWETLDPYIKRIEKLEQKSDGRGLKFCGKWNREVEYFKGDMVTHTGSIWIAMRRSDDMPGTSTDDGWTRLLKANNRGGFTEGDNDD